MTRHSTPTTLDEWLDQALQGLSEGAKNRVTPELTAHYHDAHDAHLQQGRTPVQAAHAALADLGDPQAARLAFRRTYPSISEERRYAAISQLQNSRLAKGILTAVYGALAALAWQLQWTLWPAALITAAFVAFLIYVVPGLVQRCVPAPQSGLIVWACWCPLQVFPLVSASWLTPGSDIGLLNAGLMLAAYALFLVWWLGPLWRKAAFLASPS